MKLRLVLVLVVALAWPAVAQAKPDPVTWCGTDEVSADRVPDLEVSATQQIRVVYVVPQDGADHFLQDASGIATDAAWIDQWWQTQDPTRTPRFDRYPFPSCTSTFGQLDLGFLRLSQPAASFSTLGDPSVGLDTALAGLFPASQKTIVYYDGPTSDPSLCGETDYLASSTGGDQGIAYLYLQSGCDLGAPGAGTTAEVAAHELAHNLGAVPDGAPHECLTSQNHVCDSSTDLMYPFITDGSTLDSVTLDVGRDDYYAHAGTQWDVQDSTWLEHLPQFPFSLSVGAGGTASARAGISNLPCDDGCTGVQVDNGTTLSLTALPSSGYAFAGWTGGCPGSSRLCTIAVGGPTSVAATFVRAPLQVRVAVIGRGTVTSSPAGLTCAKACRRTFAATTVRLTAKPAAGWRFKGWAGACSGRRACSLSHTGTLRAVFARR